MTNIRKHSQFKDDSQHSQFKDDSRQCSTQTKSPVTASAAVARCSVEPATTSREAPGRIPLRRSATPKEPSLFPAESPSHSRPVHPQLYIQPCQSDSLDCKACRELNVLCDHARPQCSQCYQQQTLCFYVSPRQRPKNMAEIWRWLEMSSFES
jgi:hypothetical protein